MNIQKNNFRSVKVIGSHELSGHNLLGCTFDGCALAQFDDPKISLVVQDVTVKSSIAKRCTVHGVRFDNVLVDGLSTSSPLHLSGCVFRHVKLCGKIGPVMAVPPSFSISEDVQNAFEIGIKEFYSDVDWALDISEAHFSDADFYYVPGHLVRRDPETQFLLHREHLTGVDVSDLSPYVEIAVSRFEVSPFDSLVAVAPRRARYFDEALDGFRRLRDRGLAE